MVLSSLLWALMAFTCSGSSVAQKVTQNQSAIDTQEWSTVTLNCQYETSWTDYYLCWYKQLPDGKINYLIHQASFSPNNAEKACYFLNFQKSDRAISLTINSLYLDDSAKYFCSLQEYTVLEAIVKAKQKPRPPEKQEYSSEPKLKSPCRSQIGNGGACGCSIRGLFKELDSE